MRIILGITGATGAILGIRVLQALRESGVETHLILSKWAETTVRLETDYTIQAVRDLADYAYSPADQGAAISSGSFRVDGMIIAPCSMKTLAGIRCGYAEGLMGRAADVVLKERKKLVLAPRETPLNDIHLENMLALSRMGAVIAPPVPAFYNHPAGIGDIVDHLASRILDQFDIETPFAKRWPDSKSLRRNEETDD